MCKLADLVPLERGTNCTVTVVESLAARPALGALVTLNILASVPSIVTAILLRFPAPLLRIVKICEAAVPTSIELKLLVVPLVRLVPVAFFTSISPGRTTTGILAYRARK